MLETGIGSAGDIRVEVGDDGSTSSRRPGPERRPQLTSALAVTIMEANRLTILMNRIRT